MFQYDLLSFTIYIEKQKTSKTVTEIFKRGACTSLNGWSLKIELRNSRKFTRGISLKLRFRLIIAINTRIYIVKAKVGTSGDLHQYLIFSKNFKTPHNAAPTNNQFPVEILQRKEKTEEKCNNTRRWQSFKVHFITIDSISHQLVKYFFDFSN